MKLSSTSYLVISVGRPDQTSNALREYEQPGTFALFQNYPNPFNPVINCQLIIPKVYDLLGREVATLVSEVKQPGTYSVQWNATNLASSVYFYRLTTRTIFEIKSMQITK